VATTIAVATASKVVTGSFEIEDGSEERYWGIRIIPSTVSAQTLGSMRCSF
jgi:hypothetical protein